MKNFVPMVTVDQSAANWCNTHTRVDRTHSLAQLHQHSTTTDRKTPSPPSLSAIRLAGGCSRSRWWRQSRTAERPWPLCPYAHTSLPQPPPPQSLRSSGAAFQSKMRKIQWIESVILFLLNQQTMGSNCARKIDVTHDIEHRPTTTETRVAYDTCRLPGMRWIQTYINSTKETSSKSREWV